MLALCVVLVIAFSFKRSFNSNNGLTMLVLTILCYLTMGLINMFIWEDNNTTAGGLKSDDDWVYMLRLMLQTLLVTVAIYKYTLFSHSKGQFPRFLNLLIAITLFGSIITIFSPFLGFYSPGFVVTGYKSTSSLTRPAGFYMNPKLSRLSCSGDAFVYYFFAFSS